MKRLLTIPLVLAILISALAGCSGKDEKKPAKTAQELTQLYADAITKNGGEGVEYNPVISEVKSDDASEILLEMLGLNQEDMKAFAISASLINIRVFGIAAIMPAEGKEQVVQEALQDYIKGQQDAFEFYLADQYEIAKQAKLGILEDGTVLMVMCEDQDAVFDAISADILAD